MAEVFLDALKDSSIAAPFLLAIYLLIEFLESNANAKRRTVKLLNGKLLLWWQAVWGLFRNADFR